MLFAPALLAGAWALDDPGAAAGLVPGEYQSVTQPRAEGQDLGLAPDEEAAFSAAIMTNNIRVSLLAFAAGILAGLGTAAVLIVNGVLLGAIGGLAVGAGNGRPFFELVAAARRARALVHRRRRRGRAAVRLGARRARERGRGATR